MSGKKEDKVSNSAFGLSLNIHWERRHSGNDEHHLASLWSFGDFAPWYNCQDLLTYLLTGKHRFSQQFITSGYSIGHEVLVRPASDTELVIAKVHYFIKDGEALVSRSEATAL